MLSLRAFAFAMDAPLNGLSSPQKQIPCPVFLHGLHNPVSPRSYTPLARLSFAWAPFGPWMTMTNRFQDLLIFGKEYFSAFSHLTDSLSDFRDI
jgi:hypothetical protein